MEYRILGRTGLRVSVIAFGAGPVSGLMTGDDSMRQQAAVRRAVDVGVNWFDTAPGYGQGRSESALGRCFAELAVPASVHIATKIRFARADFDDIAGAVQRSLEASLTRLGRNSVTLLQLHNGITEKRGTEPDSVSSADVLDAGGILDAFRAVQCSGLVRFIGLTGTGSPATLRKVIGSGAFDTIQTPYNLLNPSAGQVVPASFAETDFGNIFVDCAAKNMGVFAIRVFAGGALLDLPPSAHTLTTKYFPLALYERDRAEAGKLARHPESLRSAAVAFALAHPAVHAAILGFGSEMEVEEVAKSI